MCSDLRDRDNSGAAAAGALRCPRNGPRRRELALRELTFGNHLDGVHGALSVTGGAAGAAVVVVLVPVGSVALAEADDGILGARAEAAVALDAVAARQAAPRLEMSLVGGQAGDDLPEVLHPGRRLPLGLLAPVVVAEVPEVELVERRQRVLGAGRERLAAQVGVDAARGLLAVPDPDRDRALARHRVAAGE